MVKTNTAKIVFDVSDTESVEIPFEFNNTQDYGRTKYKAQKVKGSRSKFYYLDIKEFERQVREDERIRIKRQREQRIKDTIKISKAIAKYTWQKAVGACIVFNAAYIMYSNYLTNNTIGFGNWTLMLLTIPVGIYMLFSKQFFFKKRT